MSNRIQILKQRIAQLEAELRTVRWQTEAQRQRLAQKYGREFLVLLDSDRKCKVVVTDIVQKLVVQDEGGKVISETDGSFIEMDKTISKTGNGIWVFQCGKTSNQGV